MKRITALTMGIIFMSMSMVFAQEVSVPQQSSVQPVEVGNKHCPVTGEAVGKMGAPITYTYNGKIYNLCCPGCKNAFKNHPEKYSKIAQDDAKITQ